MIFSYSLLDTYHNVCPRQAHHKFVLRDVATTYTQTGGIDAHKAIEERLKTSKPLPDTLAAVEPFIGSLVKPGLKIAAEMKLGVTAKFEPVDFFDPAARYRGVPDVVAYRHEATGYLTLDWKTGKPRNNRLQHLINSTLIFSHWPKAQHITAANVYTRSGKMGDLHVFDRSKLPAYAAELTNLAVPITVDDRWLPRKGPLCAWCPVKSCEYNTGDRGVRG